MGQFKDYGLSALALMEEMAEAQQIISKAYRFMGRWDDVPPGQNKTRWEMLCEEMDDVMYQWERLKKSMNSENNEDLYFGYNPSEHWEDDNTEDLYNIDDYQLPEDTYDGGQIDEP